MLKNYFKTAWRNIVRNKTFSLINICGLALGIAISLLIFFWVNDERSVDAFHKNNRYLYNVYEIAFADNKIDADYETPALLADQIKKEIPEVQYAAGSDWNDDYTFRTDNKTIKESGAFASEDYFKIFSFPLLQGNAASALNNPFAIAISKKMATDFFGSPQSAIGKTLQRDDGNGWKTFTIAAVFDNVPANSTLKFDFVINWQAYYEEHPEMKMWGNFGPLTNIMLRDDANVESVKAKLKNFLDKFSVESSGNKIELNLQPFSERYLHSNFVNGEINGGRIEYVRLFSIIALFIILIACINFMNLATARSVKRAKEVGVRKVTGALRSSLIKQFMIEAVLLTFFAVVIALFLVSVLLPVFSNITGKHIVMPLTRFSFWLQLLGLATITGSVAGSYPALFLSSFNPAKVLKGTMKFSTHAVLFRKGLVIFQFVLSLILINATIIVSRQINFIQTKNIGYNKENLIYIPIEGTLTRQYAFFKQEAVKMQAIKQVSCIDQSLPVLDNGTTYIDWEGKATDFKPSFTNARVGYDFIKTAGIQMVQGREFSPDFPTDSIGYILNETAVKKIGYKNPLGRSFSLWGKKGTIIGVIKDFHFASLHERINPLVLHFRQENPWGAILIRTQTGQTKQAIESLSQLCSQINPKFPFTYQFADQEYQKLYKSEAVIGKLSDCFAFLAIFISCLGLLGLAMFTTEQRTKEIGVRKVLGASATSLFTLLSKEFIMLVVAALFIATPLAWLAMNKWLEDYAYRININWMIFLVAGLLAIMITLITISFQTIKAVLVNPVKSLRTE
ncbi:MAG TPA: ABC transporter permease [Puia sp.]|nr:ABC transporter permease [Puia sp.]